MLRVRQRCTVVYVVYDMRKKASAVQYSNALRLGSANGGRGKPKTRRDMETLPHVGWRSSSKASKEVSEVAESNAEAPFESVCSSEARSSCDV